MVSITFANKKAWNNFLEKASLLKTTFHLLFKNMCTAPHYINHFLIVGHLINGKSRQHMSNSIAIFHRFIIDSGSNLG